MKGHELLDAVGGIDARYTEHAEKENIVKNRISVKRRLLLAACIGLALVIALAGAAYAAEAVEYNKAVKFFNENGLSTEGLSRSDVKEVYRDITSKRFAGEKTADVIKRAVPGYEIDQEEPTPERLEELWNMNLDNNKVAPSGRTYKYDYKYVTDEESGMIELDRTVIECYDDGGPTWTAELSNYYHKAYTLSTGTTVFCGQNERTSSAQKLFSLMALIDKDGNILCETKLEHGFKAEEIHALFEDEDGEITILSRGDFKYLCLSRFDAGGRELYLKKTEKGRFSFRTAARLGDGYLVYVTDLLNSSAGSENGSVIKLDRDGNVTDDFTYESEDCFYYITDMAEFEGNVYISAYSVPKQRDAGGRHEIADILKYIFDEMNMSISDEELTSMLRDNYTALLLKCGADSGEPQTFYSAKGSLGAELVSNEDGKLEWDVQSIVSARFSPLTSAFSIYGTCNVFRYTFDESGALISSEATGEAAPYAR